MSDLSAKSAWARYRAEMGSTEFLERAEGFISYSHVSSECTYIEDLFVEPDHRKKGIASELVAEVEKIAKLSGSKFMMVSVDLTVLTIPGNLIAALSMGAIPFKAHDNKIWLKRSIEREGE